MIINFAAQPYTSEYFEAQTGVVTAFATANYLPTTGVCRSHFAAYAFMSLGNVTQTGNLRFKMNGSSPATNCGHIMVSGDYLVLDDPSQLRNFKFMNEGNTATAYVHATFFGG